MVRHRRMGHYGRSYPFLVAERSPRTLMNRVYFPQEPSKAPVTPFREQYPVEILLQIVEETANSSPADLLHLAQSCKVFAHFAVPLLKGYRFTVGLAVHRPTLEHTLSIFASGPRLDHIRSLTVFWDIETGRALGQPEYPYQHMLDGTVENVSKSATDALEAALPKMKNLQKVQLFVWGINSLPMDGSENGQIQSVLTAIKAMPWIKEITMQNSPTRSYNLHEGLGKKDSINKMLDDEIYYNHYYPSCLSLTPGLTKLSLISTAYMANSGQAQTLVPLWQSILLANAPTLTDLSLDLSYPTLFSLFDLWFCTEKETTTTAKLERLHLTDTTGNTSYLLQPWCLTILDRIFTHTDPSSTPSKEPNRSRIQFDIRSLRVLKLPMSRDFNKRTLDSVFAGHTPLLEHFSTGVLPHATIKQKDILSFPLPKLQELDAMDDQRGQTKQYNLKYLTKHAKVLKRLTVFEHWLQDDMAEFLAPKFKKLETLTTACGGNDVIHLLSSFSSSATLSTLIITDWHHIDLKLEYFTRIIDFINSGGGTWNSKRFNPKRPSHLSKCTHDKKFDYDRFVVEKVKGKRVPVAKATGAKGKAAKGKAAAVGKGVMAGSGVTKGKGKSRSATAATTTTITGSVVVKTAGFVLNAMPPTLTKIIVTARNWVEGREYSLPNVGTYVRKSVGAVGTEGIAGGGMGGFIWVLEGVVGRAAKYEEGQGCLKGYEVWKEPVQSTQALVVTA